MKLHHGHHEKPGGHGEPASHKHHAQEGIGHDHAAEAKKPWTILALIAVAQFMVILDVTVVNVALPSIGSALHFSSNDLQWVVTAYVLFTGGLMLFGGRLSDLIGRRTIFLVGLTVFTGASLASGLASGPDALIVSRGAQGIGAALLLPSALSIITTTYAGHQRAAALAIWGMLGSAGAAAGVLFGGILTDALGWRSVFFINVPTGIVVGLLALHVVPKASGAGWRNGKIDFSGAAALMSGLVALILAIQGISQYGWTSPRTVALALGAIALVGVFAATERRVPQPLIPPATWRIGTLVSSATVMLTATGILVGGFFLNTLYLQRVLDASPVATGLAFLPLTLVILVAAHVASHLMPKLGSRTVMATGLGITAVGALLLSGAPVNGNYVSDLLPGFIALGFGVGLVFVSASVAAMADVSHEQAGLASGLMTTAHELGAATGVAILAAIATAGGSSISALVDGYSNGFLVAGAVAATMGLAAAIKMPSVRPAPGAAHGMH